MAFLEIDMRSRAQATVDDVIASNAALAFAQPWRIARAVYGNEVPTIWPVAGKTTAEVLADCLHRLEGERMRRAHWTFDANRLIGLRSAEAALKQMAEGR